MTPPGLAPGSPTGSYSLSDFENVNLFSGNFNFNLPLVTIGGRGRPAGPINLSIDSTRWEIATFDASGSTPNWPSYINNSPDFTSENFWLDATATTQCVVIIDEASRTAERRCELVFSNDRTLPLPVQVPSVPGARFFFVPIPRPMSIAGWSYDEMEGYAPGYVRGRDSDSFESYDYPVSDPRHNDPRYHRIQSLYRMTFIDASGTEHEMVDQKTGGRPIYHTFAEPVDRGNVFVSTDGSSMTFVRESPPEGSTFNGERGGQPTGYLFLADGTRCRVLTGRIKSITDPNGNTTTYEYWREDGEPLPRLHRIKDSLGREVTISYAKSPTVLYDEIKFNGFGSNLNRSVKVWRTSMGESLRDGEVLKTVGQLFSLGSRLSSTPRIYNPTIISKVELPDGRFYELKYNSYGEIARVKLPTDGVIEYDYTNPQITGYSIQRRLKERRVSLDGGATWESKQSYSAEGTIGSNNSIEGWSTAVTVETRDTKAAPEGLLVSKQKHYFTGHPLAATSPRLVYPSWLDGREYKTEYFDTTGNATTVLRTEQNTWEQGQTPDWWPTFTKGQYQLIPTNAPPRNPRVAEVKQTLENGLVSRKVFKYSDNANTNQTTDSYNNLTDTYEYGYSLPDSPAPLLRHTHTDFVKTLSINGTTYDYGCAPNTSCGQTADVNTMIHIRNLPQTVEVREGATDQVMARTVLIYDETGAVTDLYGALPADFPGWVNPATPARGNLTTKKVWLNTLGDYQNDNAYLKTQSFYDRFGNATITKDARGNVSEMEFSAEYKYAFPTRVKSADPDGTGPLGSLETRSVFDFATGLLVSKINANNVISNYFYNDLLDRPTRVETAANVPGLKNQTTFDYDDVGHRITITSDLNSYGDNSLKSEVFYDALGRTTETRKYETSSQYTAILQKYDALGRTTEVSNPFRAGTTPVWTRTKFDSLGRVTMTTTPDDPNQSKAAPLNSSQIFAYWGSLTQITDQDGKSRRTETDALGRATAVVEFTRRLANPGVVDNPGSSDYTTNYKYDTLDHLRMVEQGGQLRFFAYDSLDRLIRAKNPEQDNLTEDQYFTALADSSSGIGNSNWSQAYQYDENGNLIRRKDARNVSAIYTYDALNRNTNIRYEGETDTSTPGINISYDGAINGKGLPYLTVTPGVSKTVIDEYDELGRIKKQRQNFWSKQQASWSSGTWGTDFTTQRTYNLSGGVTTQTYPSEHKVFYQYDSSGRLADSNNQPAFKGNLGDGQQRTYASALIYDAFGNTNQERFGTDVPVYDKRFYNQRGQLAELRVGTNAFPDTNWNRGAILNVYTPSPADGWTSSGANNNGNLRKQMIYIPKGDNPDTAGWSQFTQYYGYDQLNRLTSVEEKLGDNTTLNVTQKYDYDRWGNRTINAGATSNAVNKKQFAVNMQNNRLGVPAGQPGAMNYDGTGNLVNDTYTGAGLRAYDAENRMTTAQIAADQSVRYTYDGGGQRVKRSFGTNEVWQVFGLGGELIAEYAAQANPSNPQKEYGYRSGKLLIVASPSSNSANVLTDFSATQNPSGAWSYGYRKNGAFTLFNVPHNSYGAGLDSWGVTELPYLSVTRNSGGNPTLPPDMLYLHPGPNGEKSIVRWTSPIAGTIQIAGKFQGADPVGTTTDVSILQNGTSVFSGNINGYGQQAPFSLQLTVAPGDAIEFAVGFGANGTYNNDVTGLIATITGAGSSNNAETYKASTQFSSVQGQGQWFYQIWNGTNYSNMTWDSQNNVWTGPELYSYVWNTGQHPGSNIDTVRKWVAPRAGTIRIKAQVSKGDTRGGDGVNVKILQNSALLFDKNIAYNDATGYTVDLTRTVAKDDVLYFRLNRFGNSSYDSTNFDPVIEYQTIIGATDGDIRWLVADQLGSPRMVVDKTGSLTGVSRQDFLPFGEELTAGRSTQQGYKINGIRQKFTGYERDSETGLDYAQARYYANTQGRFTSVDPLLASGKPINPQTWNRYTYTRNNPLRFIDSSGLDIQNPQDIPRRRYETPIYDEKGNVIGSDCDEFCSEQKKRDEFSRELNILANFIRGAESLTIPYADAGFKALIDSDYKGAIKSAAFDWAVPRAGEFLIGSISKVIAKGQTPVLYLGTSQGAGKAVLEQKAAKYGAQIIGEVPAGATDRQIFEASEKGIMQTLEQKGHVYLDLTVEGGKYLKYEQKFIERVLEEFGSKYKSQIHIIQ